MENLSISKKNSINNNDSCCICLNNFSIENPLNIFCNRCNQGKICFTCIDSIIKNNSCKTCPVCKNEKIWFTVSNPNNNKDLNSKVNELKDYLLSNNENNNNYKSINTQNYINNNTNYNIYNNSICKIFFVLLILIFLGIIGFLLYSIAILIIFFTKI